MPKRQHETEIWNKRWFRELTAKEKIAFFYIKDNCDYVGVWDADFAQANFLIGSKIDWDILAVKANDNIVVLDNGKWFLIDFCEFQYGGINPTSNSYLMKNIIKRLNKHGLLEMVEERGENNKPRPTGIDPKTAVKEEIFSRDNYRCIYCGTTDRDALTIDHVLAKNKGGKYRGDNLVTACRSCNGKKGDDDVLLFVNKLKNKEEILGYLTTVAKYCIKKKDKEKKKEKEKEEYAPGVKMPREEYQDLCERFGKKKIDGIIERISDYQLSKGKKKYEDYPATIKNWMRKDAGVDSVKELEIPKIPKCPKCGKSLDNEVKNDASHCYSCMSPIPKNRGP